MSKSANLSLPLILPSQAQKHVTHNEALLMLDTIVQLSVHSRNNNDVPDSIGDNDQFLIGANPNGLFEDHPLKLAIIQNNEWIFYKPKTGWLAWIDSENLFVVFDGENWVPIESSAQDSVPQLGINASADIHNRLSINATGSLFNHDGDSHRMVINKATHADTASLIFQTGFSGRAEFGLTGDDNFSIKMTPDGENWQSALHVDSLTGETNIGPLTVVKQLENRLLPAFKMTGEALDGSSSNDEQGVGLYLSHNGSPANRQFAILSTDSRTGLRTVIGNNTITLDGFNDGGRADLTIGTSTNGAHIATTVANTQFSVNNWAGTRQKTVLELAGAADQTGNYLNISSAGGFSNHGDILAVQADGQMDVGGPLKLKSYSLDNLPDATTTGAGALIFITDGVEGPQISFNDGVQWRYVADNSTVQ